MSKWFDGWPGASVSLQRQPVLPLQALSQCGQVLPFGLILSAVVLIAWVLSLNVGRLVHNKASLLRATDAAVY